MQRRIKLMALVVALAGCRVEHAHTNLAPWWRATCGDIQPLGVMAGHDIVPPVLVRRVEPQWPRDRVRGIIIVETVLDDEGRVCAARVLRGMSETMDAAALDAVKQWRFTPVRLNGHPRPAFYNLTVAVN
jgi:TonB family protein